MNRRSLLSGVLACLVALVTGRIFRRRYLYRLDDVTPSWRFADVPVFWELAWSGRIVRQPSPVPGQREQCCGCGGSESHPMPLDRCPLHVDGGDCMGRTPIPGSPERAYLEYIAKHLPHPEYAHSEYHVLRRLKSGELAVDDVYIRLASAEEIDAPGSPYAGGRGEAFAPYITVLA